MAKDQKKLILLEYLEGSPCVGPQIFEDVGFEVRWTGWSSWTTDAFWKEIFPIIEKWQPDVIVFLLEQAYLAGFGSTEEPREWILACQRIRENPHLQHTKIVGFLGPRANTSKAQEAEWHRRYDFHTREHLRVIEHARVIRGLVGETVKGFEGVNYCLQEWVNWDIQGYLSDEPSPKDARHPDAVGQFSEGDRVKTRWLLPDKDNGYAWGDRIRINTPTYIVYAIRGPEEWQREGLDPGEVERLSWLAGQAPPDCQLLIGADEVLLEAGPEIVEHVLEQAWQAGGWRVFINEHLWFNWFCRPEAAFEAMVYQGKQVPLQESFFAM
ncbi:MAG: hypothetical protein P8186_32375 [Anaerolineae bacterium]